MSFVFFFKQKTAYEMRISDWSSDVCSSDLDRAIAARHKRRQRGLHAEKHAGLVDRNDPVPPFDRLVLDAGVMDDTGSVRERGERAEGGEGGGDGRLPAFAVRNAEPDEFRLAAIRLDRRGIVDPPARPVGRAAHASVRARVWQYVEVPMAGVSRKK